MRDSGYGLNGGTEEQEDVENLGKRPISTITRKVQERSFTKPECLPPEASICQKGFC